MSDGIPPPEIVFRCDPALIDVLPRPVPAAEGLPGWLRAMPAEAPVAGVGPVRTLKHCPPFLDAMRAGFLMPLAADLTADDDGLSWDWSPPPAALGLVTRSPVGFHHPEQAAGVVGDPERVIVKFANFWTITTPPGWSVLVTHPANRLDLPFRTLTGIVDADLYGDGLIHFPALWTDPAFRGLLPAGTPVAQVVPVPRAAWTMRAEPLAGEAAERFTAVKTAVGAEPGVYRKTYRARER